MVHADDRAEPEGRLRSSGGFSSGGDLGAGRAIEVCCKIEELPNSSLAKPWLIVSDPNFGFFGPLI